MSKCLTKSSSLKPVCIDARADVCAGMRVCSGGTAGVQAPVEVPDSALIGPIPRVSSSVGHSSAPCSQLYLLCTRVPSRGPSDPTYRASHWALSMCAGVYSGSAAGVQAPVQVPDSALTGPIPRVSSSAACSQHYLRCTRIHSRGPSDTTNHASGVCMYICRTSNLVSALHWSLNMCAGVQRWRSWCSSACPSA